MSNKRQDYQISIPGNLKGGLQKRSSECGFASIEEAVNLIIQCFVQGRIDVTSAGIVEYLDDEADARLGESLQDFEKGNSKIINMRDPESVNKFFEAD